jgi:hypothetical protein
MSLIVESGGHNNKQYPVASEGAHRAQLLQVKDLGLQETRFGAKHRVRFVWEIEDERAPDGSTLRCFQSFNLSFDVKSHLRKAVKQILGRDPGDRFDLESLAGTRATLIVGHDEGAEGKLYANVRAVLPVKSVDGAA